MKAWGARAFLVLVYAPTEVGAGTTKEVRKKSKAFFKGAPLRCAPACASTEKMLILACFTQTEVCSARINSCPDTSLLVVKHFSAVDALIHAFSGIYHL